MKLLNLKSDVDEKYSRKVDTPQYLPSAVKPDISALYDKTKYVELLRDIEKSNVSEEEKTFLKFAAARHIMFNYSRIADYYAHSDAEMQKLMEDSALVIIDVNDAIANGYVKLSKDIKDLISGEQ